MIQLLFIMFLVVPILEVAIFVALGSMIGFWWTMGGVIITAVAGSVLLRIQGIAVWRDMQQQWNSGQFPARSIADGIMLAIAGALLVTPGYLSDAVGFCLFIGRVRHAIYDYLRHRTIVVSRKKR